MKLALVTGASSGIGKAASRELLQAGYHVVLVARNEDRLRDVATELGEATTIIPCDVSCGNEVRRMATQVQRDLGTPDVVVNSAGVGQWKRVEETSPEEALAMMQAPYLAAFNITHAFMKGMLRRRSGVFIHVNSGAALAPWSSSVGYAAARWALRGFNEALNQDLRGTGVHSCGLILGHVDSPYFARNDTDARELPGIARTVRTLSCEECGRLILWLAQHPRRELIYPRLLRFYNWINALFPQLVRFLIWRTGRK